MADRTMTMSVILNAVLNGGFSGVFSQAQQKFAQLGTEIRALQNIQKDITAYQKQNQAVENTTRKLESYQRQQALVKEQMEALQRVQTEDVNKKAEIEAEVKALERVYEDYNQRMARTSQGLEEQKGKLEATSQRLQDAGVDLSGLGEKSGEVTQRLEELKKEQEALTEELRQGGAAAGEFGERGAAGVEALASAMAASGIVSAVNEVKDAFLSCVDAAGEFEYAMSAVEAISDATGEEMDALTEKAKQIGLTTVYTAQQSANAMEYMAMAGWDADEMLSGMEGMVNLAAAAGEDLAQVSDIVTDNLTAFGMEASETGHFADVLAAAAANSNTNIQKMGDSFKSSSAVAGALGYTVEDVAVALGLMANNAVKGSRAGTALRNIFNGFVSGMTLTGASFGEVEVSAVNADGSIKGFLETIDELRGWFGQMTGAEKIQNAYEIAGLRGYNGLLALLNATEADYEGLYEDINNCAGAAERMAQVKLDNMKGDLTILKSAMEGFAIAVGEQFEPEARGLYQTLTDLTDWGSQFVRDNPVLVKTLAGTAAGLLGISTVLTGIAAAKKLIAFAGIGADALLLAGGVGAVVAAMHAARQEMEEIAPSAKTLTEETREATAAIREARDAYNETEDSTLAAAEVAARYAAKLRLLEAAGEASDAVNSEYQITLGRLLDLMPELADSIDITTDAYGREVYQLKGSTDALLKNIEAVKENARAQAQQDYLTELYSNQNKVLLEQQKNYARLSEAAEKREDAEARVAMYTERVNALEAGGRKWGREWSDAHNAQQDAIDDLDLWAYEEEQAGKAVQTQAAAVADADDEIARMLELMDKTASSKWENIDLTEEETAVLEDLNGLLNATSEGLLSQTEAYQEAYEAAYEAVQKQYSLFEEAGKLDPMGTGTQRENLTSQADYWAKVNSSLAKIQEKLDSGKYDGLAEYVADIGIGTEDSANALAGLANSTETGLQKTLDEWNRNNEEQQKAVDAYSEILFGLRGDADETISEINDLTDELLDNLDISSEARKAGVEAIDSYLDGLRSSLKPLIGVSPEIDALDKKLRNAQIRLTYEASGTPMDAWVWSGAYASGVSRAMRGVALVGEKGPELVYMNGGETVVPAATTAALLGERAGAGAVSYTVTVNVQGGATEDTARDIARAVRETLEDLEEDRRRRSYT